MDHYFGKIWSNGFNRPVDDESCAKLLKLCLYPFAIPQGVALEIGYGTGWWTKYLAKLFKWVEAVDITGVQLTLPQVRTHTLDPETCKLDKIPDNSIDFVWSYAVFCYFPQSFRKEYLKEIFKKMRPGAIAVIMFANYDRDPSGWKRPREQILEDIEYNPYRESGGWYYDDIHLTQRAIEESGFVHFLDMVPVYRCTMARMQKPGTERGI